MLETKLVKMTVYIDQKMGAAHPCKLDKGRYNREIYIQGEGALPLVQLSINFKLCCWKRRN